MDIRLRVEKLFGNMVTVKMNRMLLRIEYDGTPFVGWQTQENGISIQKELEVAAQKLIGEPTHIQGAGRTGLWCTRSRASCPFRCPIKLFNSLRYDGTEQLS